MAIDDAAVRSILRNQAQAIVTLCQVLLELTRGAILERNPALNSRISEAKAMAQKAQRDAASL